MGYTLEEHKLDNGYKVVIEADDDASYNDPRDWCNTSRMAMSHRRYTLPNEVDFDFDSCNSWSEVRDALIKDHGALHIHPVYMIDHSGIAFRMGRDFGDCDPGHWDSGQVGFVFATKESLAETGTPEDKIDECLNGEVEVYSRWQEGGTFGWVTYDPDGHVVDSCWGYLDDTTDYAVSEGKAAAEWHLEQQEQKAADLAADNMSLAAMGR